MLEGLGRVRRWDGWFHGFDGRVCMRPELRGGELANELEIYGIQGARLTN